MCAVGERMKGEGGVESKLWVTFICCFLSESEDILLSAVHATETGLEAVEGGQGVKGRVKGRVVGWLKGLRDREDHIPVEMTKTNIRI